MRVPERTIDQQERGVMRNLKRVFEVGGCAVMTTARGSARVVDGGSPDAA